MSYDKYTKNLVYCLETDPIFCQNSAWNKKKLNFHLSVLIAMDTLCQCSALSPAVPHGGSLHQGVFLMDALHGQTQ